jgi:hypothetical protein
MRVSIRNLDPMKGAIRKGIGQKVLEATQKVTLEAHRNLVLASPAKTGAFRGAWTAETPSKPYENGWVENATQYATALANGHSPQAPAGWVENELVAATKQVK